LLTAKKITHLGIANLSDMLELFSFDRPNISSLGWSEVPILDFRATLLGDSSDGGHTLLTLIVPHLITDAGGAASIVEAWGKLYHGEPVAKASGESHPDLLRLLNPVVAAQAKVNQEEEGRGTGWSSGLFAVALWLRELIQHQKNGPEDHYIHFPAVVLEKYRDEARKLSSNEHEGLPVSRYDIFTAMIIKVRHEEMLTVSSHRLNGYANSKIPAPCKLHRIRRRVQAVRLLRRPLSPASLSTRQLTIAVSA
jgi:hypothetical protein